MRIEDPARLDHRRILKRDFEEKITKYVTVDLGSISSGKVPFLLSFNKEKKLKVSIKRVLKALLFYIFI